MGSTFAKGANGAHNGSVQPADAVALSDEAWDIQRIRQVLCGVPDVREDRVVALQRQVRAGTYVVPVDDLASRLLCLRQ